MSKKKSRKTASKATTADKATKELSISHKRAVSGAAPALVNDAVSDIKLGMAAKDPANQTHAERMAALSRDLHSPAVIAKADKILELMGHEFRDIHNLRTSAALRHRIASVAPALPPLGESLPATQGADASGEMTWRSLAYRYRNDERSPYRQNRFSTRQHYDTLLDRILIEHGDDKLSAVTAEKLEEMYASWTKSGFTMAHSLVGMQRTLANFGAVILKEPACDKLSIYLQRLKIKVGPPRGGRSPEERLTREHATAIIAKAHDLRHHAVALAQAFQFDLALRQKDVLGEWVPHSEPGVSDVTKGDYKWLRGIRWNQIDRNLVLRHVLSRTQKSIERSLRDSPLIMAELIRLGDLPQSGPLVINERTKLPYSGDLFRKLWRDIAHAAGVPRNVKNMDSRIAGGGSTHSREDRRQQGGV